MRRREISQLAAALVVGFCGCFQVEEYFLKSLKVMMQLC